MAKEKIIGIDLGTTNSVVAVMERRRGQGHPQPGRQPPDPQRRRLHRQGRAAGRRPGQAAGGHQPAAHRSTRSSASWAAGTRRSSRKRSWSRTRSSAGPNELVKVDIDGKQYTPPEISAMILRKLKEAAEAYLGPHRPQGGHHGAGVLQRRPAAGDHRRGPDRRLRHRMGDRGPQDRQEDQAADAHHQRADGRLAGLRRSTRRRTRRSPSSTWAAARSTSRSSTSATASSR